MNKGSPDNKGRTLEDIERIARLARLVFGGLVNEPAPVAIPVRSDERPRRRRPATNPER